MNIIYHFMFFAIIYKIKCDPPVYEEYAVTTEKEVEDKFTDVHIARRFLDDLDDHEWHVAHLRTAVFEGREDCDGETFEEKARRYKRMLKQDAGRVKFVSAHALPDPKPEDILQETCKIKQDEDKSSKVTSASLFNVTLNNDNVEPTAAALNVLLDNTTASMKVADDTTPNIDFKATTVKSKVKSIRKKKKKLVENSENPGNPKNDTLGRRASEYQFSSEEYYESIELNSEMCPDVLDIITLEIDQLRTLDLECEMTVEWRSLD